LFQKSARIAHVPFSTLVNVGSDYFVSMKGIYGEIECPTTSNIIPLTNNKEALIAHIDNIQITPHSATAGHLGTAWSWYVLSDKWDRVWNSPVDTTDYNTGWNDIPNTPTEVIDEEFIDPKKIAVLMTDGEYNASYSDLSSKEQASILCAEMKADDIVIFTVGFEISKGNSADKIMSECASSPAHYYHAKDGTALKAAYADIAGKMFLVHLSH